MELPHSLAEVCQGLGVKKKSLLHITVLGSLMLLNKFCGIFPLKSKASRFSLWPLNIPVCFALLSLPPLNSDTWVWTDIFYTLKKNIPLVTECLRLNSFCFLIFEFIVGGIASWWHRSLRQLAITRLAIATLVEEFRRKKLTYSEPGCWSILASSFLGSQAEIAFPNTCYLRSFTWRCLPVCCVLYCTATAPHQGESYGNL